MALVSSSKLTSDVTLQKPHRSSRYNASGSTGSQTVRDLLQVRFILAIESKDKNPTNATWPLKEWLAGTVRWINNNIKVGLCSRNQADRPANVPFSAPMRWNSQRSARVCPRHADGLISARATTTNCPSAQLKIVTEEEKSGKLCSLQSSVAWEHSGKVHHEPQAQGGRYKWQKIGKYKSSAQYFFSHITYFCCEVPSCPR